MLLTEKCHIYWLNKNNHSINWSNYSDYSLNNQKLIYGQILTIINLGKHNQF